MEAFPRLPARTRYDSDARGIDSKVVIMGSTGVGKTSLLHRYAQDKFDPTTPTTGALLLTKKVQVNKLKVRLQLWDTAGQERFRSMAPMYYRGANAALLLYDITNRSTFLDVRGWLEELKRNCDSNLIIYIVGAKSDLTSTRQVTPDFARLSLHQWFPPIEPPPRTPTPPPASTFSYIRPRFTSFNSARSVPMLAQPAPHSSPSTTDSLDNLKSRNGSQPPPIRRHNTSASATPYSRARTSSAGAVVLTRSASARPAAGRFMNHRMQPAGWNDAGDSTTLLNEDDEDAAKFDEPKATKDDEPILSNQEWGLQAGMELFEVSAKDDKGVKHLFDSLIAVIVARRDAIEEENIIRRRDSIFLSSVHEPAWAEQAEEEEAREEAAAAKSGIFSYMGSGWACCAT